MAATRTASIMIIVIASVFILSVGKSLLIPLILGFLIWFLIVSLRNRFMKLPVIGPKLPRWLWTVVSTLTFLALYVVVIDLLIDNIQILSKKIPQYTQNFSHWNEWLVSNLDINLSKYEAENFSNESVGKLVSGLGRSLSGLFSNLFMILLYVIFLFSEEVVFNDKLKAIFPNEEQHDEIKATLAEIGRSIQEYVSLKTTISFITALVSYVALYFIGLDTPIFWAALIFILNFIPTVGSLIATLFPALVAFVQYGDATHPILVLGIVGAIQVVVGNLLEPKLMGRSLNLSSLVVILALSFWTAVWGVAGAVLSVPIMVMLMIIFKHFDSTRGIARALSAKGKLN